MKKLLCILLFISVFSPIVFVHAQISIETPVKILLVPGHDDDISGAQYGNMKEADMNLRLATELFNILKKDKRFEVHITRQWGGYTKEFADYFSLHQDDILDFKENAKKEMQTKIKNGDFIEKENAPHNSASEDVATRLYGFNKWANENEIDGMIHIHFNDYPRAQNWVMGVHKGFVIYMPDGEMANWLESAQLAGSIFKELKKKYITSTYEKESGGLIPDQKLIALGANGTLLPLVRSVLIEYGYIYRFGNSSMRHQAYKDMAQRTATGIKNYFFSGK